MNLLKIFSRSQKRNIFYNDPTVGGLQFNSFGSFQSSKSMQLSAVYRCVNVLSDSVAALPLEPFKIDEKGYKSEYREHPTFPLLSIEPNPNMSRFTFFKTLVAHVLLRGNAYAEIIRDENFLPKGLILLDPDTVSLYVIDGNLKYVVAGRNGVIDKANMIHVLNYTYDGIIGVSTIQYANDTLECANNAEKHAAGFFKNGANMSGVLTQQGGPPLTSKQKDDIRKSWQTTLDPITGSPNGIVIVDGNMSYAPITVKPVDAQMLESRKFSVLEICRFFGVPPSKVFDMDKATYSNVESNQISFLTDSLTPLLEKIELEFFRKLFFLSERLSAELRFNLSNLLRADSAARADYYTKMFNLGAYTTNEIRKELQKESVEGGDRAFIQVNVQPLDSPITGDQTKKQLDNQLK